MTIFTGLLVQDSFSVVMQTLLMLFALLFVTFTRISGVPNDDDATEFYVMVLGAMIGLCIMVSANQALMVVLGIEMASVPCYVLAGILRHRRASSEAALKYAVFGAAAAGVMLYGISLLTGVLGSAHLPTMVQRLATWLTQPGDAQHRATAVVLALGGLMTLVGLAFKLSAVPFHFWAPDVFEGAPAEVGRSFRSPRRPPPWPSWRGWHCSFPDAMTCCRPRRRRSRSWRPCVRTCPC